MLSGSSMFRLISGGAGRLGINSHIENRPVQCPALLATCRATPAPRVYDRGAGRTAARSRYGHKTFPLTYRGPFAVASVETKWPEPRHRPGSDDCWERTCDVTENSNRCSCCCRHEPASTNRCFGSRRLRRRGISRRRLARRWLAWRWLAWRWLAWRWMARRLGRTGIRRRGAWTGPCKRCRLGPGLGLGLA
jgi:hypothetical protein